MRPVIAIAVIAGSLASAPAHAQDPGQIFGRVLNEVVRQVDRHQQRQFDRQQRKIQQRNRQLLLRYWNACFDNSDKGACSLALTAPNLSFDDRQRLIAQRGRIIAAEAARAAEVRREQMEVAERARRQRLASERHARQLEAERLARQRAAEQRRIAIRDYNNALDGCRRFMISACDMAMDASVANPIEVIRMRDWRATSAAFAVDRDACKSGDIAACDRAALSPAADQGDKQYIAGWRLDASPLHRAAAFVGTHTSAASAMIMATPAELMALPPSTHMVGAIALTLAMALGFVLYRGRNAPAPAEAPPSPWPARWRRTRRWLYGVSLRLRVWLRDQEKALATATQPRPAPTPPISGSAGEPPKRPEPRDPETALAALQLANAYLIELEVDTGDLIGNPAKASAGLNTLSLMSRQLDIAERADPATTLDIDCDNGSTRTVTLAEMKAQALYLEALCRATDKPKRAIAILEQAANLAPHVAHYPYFAGLLNAEILNKGAAIAAFEKALALDPDNLQYRKELLRAQSISGVEIAYDRAANGVRKTANGMWWLWVVFLLFVLGSFVSNVLTLMTSTDGVARTNAGVGLVIMWVALALVGWLFRGLDRAKQWFGQY